MMDTITVRQMPFEFPDEIDPVFIEGDHEQSFAFIAGSLQSRGRKRRSNASETSSKS